MTAVGFERDPSFAIDKGFRFVSRRRSQNVETSISGTATWMKSARSRRPDSNR
jgi:hypothetical protein